MLDPATLANNFQIPYAVTNDLVYGCTDKESSLNILNDISDTLSDMESLVNEDEAVQIITYRIKK